MAEKHKNYAREGVALAIILILLNHAKEVIRSRAFLNSGSDTSLIVDDLANEPGLDEKPEIVYLKTRDNKSSSVRNEVDIELHSLDFSSSVRSRKC